MKYSMDQKRYPDSVDPPFYPCDYIDADGKKLYLPAVYVDTESGHVIYQARDPETGEVLHEDGEITLIETYRPAPLTPFPITQHELSRLYPKRK